MVYRFEQWSVRLEVFKFSDDAACSKTRLHQKSSQPLLSYRMDKKPKLPQTCNRLAQCLDLKPETLNSQMRAEFEGRVNEADL